MKNILISTIIALMAVSIGLYAQEKEKAQEESIQTEEVNPVQKDEAFSNGVTLELVWEKEIPTKVKDWWPYMSNFIFLDEEGYNLFSSISKGSTRALENKRMLYLNEGKIQFLQGDNLKPKETIDLGYSPRAEISKNGMNIVVVNPVHKIGDLIEPTDGGAGEPTIQKIVHQEGEPAILRLFNSNGELLGEDTIGLPSDIYPLGNDKIVVLDYGEWSHIEVYRRNGTQFEKVQEYDGYFLDYSEDGSYALVAIDPHGKNERVIIDNEGQEALRYHHDKKAWRGFVSPKGNYIAEVTRGQYIVLFDKNGNAIAEHQVQGTGNYHASFSHDEKYFCVTPGPWRVYFLKTQTGKLLSEYVDPDTTSHFQSIAISSNPVLFFIGFSFFDPIRRSGMFTTTDRGLFIFDSNGLLIVRHNEVFSGKGFGTHLHSAALWCNVGGNYLLVGTPTKCYLYRILKRGEK